jgi:hypothetical protein
MLVFIDESYDRDGQGRIHHALAGFGISEAGYRKLLAIVHQVKERYFESADGMTSEQRAELRTRRIACSGEPRRAELKATKLLTAKAAQFHVETGSAQSILLVEELLDEVYRLEGVVFGVLSEPDHVDQIQRPGGALPIQLRALMERIEAWMAESFPNDYATLIFDAIDNKTSRELNACVSDFLFRHAEGKRMRHLVPTPFWVDSDSTPGSQVADIIAHVLMNSMLPEARRKPLASVWRRVNGMMFTSQDGRIRGIRRLKR